VAAGITKQNVSLTTSPSTTLQIPITKSQEFIISLSPEISQTSLLPFGNDGQIEAVISPSSCGSISPISGVGVSNPNRERKFTFTANNNACNATITLQYTGNTWFNNVSNYQIQVTVVAPTPTPTNTPTSTPTHTPTSTPTHTPTSTPTHTPTSTPTHTPTSTPTNTPTP
jgi:hypothetical protein